METNTELKILLPKLTDAILTLAKAISQMQPSSKNQAGGEKMQSTNNPIPMTNSPVTFEQLQSKLIALSRSGRQESIKAMLNYYGVKKLSELPKEKYEEMYEEVCKW